MKKMNKMYEAPKAEVVELNVMNVVMDDTLVGADSATTSQGTQFGS
jgi:hypothetical protein